MFQFTQPKRAATKHPLKRDGSVSFNSRSPSGLRRGCRIPPASDKRFNSRSPSGLRLHWEDFAVALASFNSRSPSGLRPCKHLGCLGLSCCFNSRSPSGLRLAQVLTTTDAGRFQFTQPKRAATHSAQNCSTSMQFQFTQPKRAATGSSRPLLIMITRFNSRSPSGLRLVLRTHFKAQCPVSIHAAQAGCDALPFSPSPL